MLALLYGSAIAVVPLLMALPSILVSFLMLYGLEQLVSISNLEQYLVAFIGLGVAIDYSLLIVTRWREERERGLGNHDAILVALPPLSMSVPGASPSVPRLWPHGATAAR